MDNFMNNNQKQLIPIITVDGPSGTGKGTISHKLARYLKWHYLDSGAIYRALAYAAKSSGVDMNDSDALALKAHQFNVSFQINADFECRTYCDNHDISTFIRAEECGQNASRIAALPKVRAALMSMQHAFVKPPGLVTDGRDMGTVVFPDATLKLFLVASVEERARRRFQQLKNMQNDVNLAQVIEQLSERDARDALRSCSPLKPAEDAIQIDSTDLSIEQVFDKVLNVVKQNLFLAEK